MLRAIGEDLRLIALTQTLIILDNRNASSNYCFIIHGHGENNKITKTLSHETNFVIALGDHVLGTSTQLINHL